MSASTTTTTIDILILGAGWTSVFLIPLCQKQGVTYASTTRNGRNGTLPFVFDPSSDDAAPFESLPDSQTVLIVFPITERGGSEKLVKMYKETRKDLAVVQPRFIQLGTTSIWGSGKPTSGFEWFDRHSPYTQNPRAVAERELLDLSPIVSTTVMNLSGLWGGTRSIRNYVWKIAGTKDMLREKGSIHLIHGIDVARAILAVHANFTKANGQRWILTDGRVYDWWDLASAWGSKSRPPGTASESSEQTSPESRLDKEVEPQARWVRELMRDQGIKALPRNVEQLERALDSREFWETFELSPIRARLEGSE